MRIVQFCLNDGKLTQDNIKSKNNIKVGIQLDNEFGDVIDLKGDDIGIQFNPRNSLELINAWEANADFKESLKRLVANSRENAIPRSDIIVLAPILAPGKVVG